LGVDLTRLSRSTFYVDARLDLAHRRLLAAPDTAHLQDHLLALLGGAVRRLGDGPTRADVREQRSDAPTVAAAREAILAGHPAAHGLLPLASLLAVSPYRLSRAFSRQMGVSLTRYRNRVRVARALDRLAQGEADLAGIAADLGFADHAHLTRTVRQHLGHTPTAVRDLLAIYTSK
ncbi:MAG TPA: helix-turn-helix transcriptional regulator, partial [Candidatus Limnocylindrales bacterium]